MSSGQSESCGRLEPECSESEEGAVESKLEEVKSELQAAIEKRRQDRRTFEKFNYEVGWFEGLENVSFNDPCLQKLLEEFREDIAPLLEEIGDIRAKLRALWEQFKEKRDSMDPVFEALRRRGDLWSTMLEFRGEESREWREIREGRPILIPAGGGLIDAKVGKFKLQGVNIPKPIIIGPELQGRFQEEIARRMIAG